LKKAEEYLQKAARCREMAETVAPADRQRLEQIAQSLEMLAELEKRLPAEDDNVIEFVLQPNDSKRKK
jgi:aminoglycoside phosphotransferase